jgi:predicted nucleotidyltransferase
MTPASDLPAVIQVVRAHRGQAREQGIELVGVVGSFARGDASSDSDVDILHEIVGKPTLFDLGGLLMDLQDELGRKVGLVDRGMIKPRIRAAMEQDLAPL